MTLRAISAWLPTAEYRPIVFVFSLTFSIGAAAFLAITRISSLDRAAILVLGSIVVGGFLIAWATYCKSVKHQSVPNVFDSMSAGTWYGTLIATLFILLLSIPFGFSDELAIPLLLLYVLFTALMLGGLAGASCGVGVALSRRLSSTSSVSSEIWAAIVGLSCGAVSSLASVYPLSLILEFIVAASRL